MRVKTSKDYTVTCWPSIDGGDAQYNPTPTINSTTEWTTISSSFKANIAIDQLGFQFGTFQGDLYLDDVSLTEEGSTENLLSNGDFSDDDLTYWTHPSWLDETVKREKEESGGSSSYSDEKVRDTLTWAMNNWIKGMMGACAGKVKAWDVVNEPMSDIHPDSLKSGAVEGDTKKNFYWQDYLGKDYARIAVKLARKYGPSSLKLFINDYNLEAAYNDNAKCKGLINMIKYWESDGVTKIDGIGSQMHVSYSMNSATQKKNEDAYINMLKLLAASGKLVRISELDMGCLDTDGNKILTENITDAEKKGMAAYYKFIVEKYLEIIPPAQQYGICQWSVVDSPSSSGWRAGQPIGLWDESYNRKSTYGGFADGLMEK
jgi:GH35 family endo-1,4-beta-xylanase